MFHITISLHNVEFECFSLVGTNSYPLNEQLKLTDYSIKELLELHRRFFYKEPFIRNLELGFLGNRYNVFFCSIVSCNNGEQKKI